MLKTLRILSSFLLFFTPKMGFSTECILISGIDKDHNRAFAYEGQDSFYKYGGKLGRMHCKSFGHWSDASEYLNSHPLPPNSQLLILQAAHGAPGGDAVCDKGMVSGTDTMRYLRTFSKSYKVAFLTSSCYSGDLIRQQLEQDELSNEEHLMSHLCIGATSIFGLPARAEMGWIVAIRKAESSSSIEDVYKKSKAGLISSAAWGQIGLPAYFLHQTTNFGWSALKNMNQILANSTHPACQAIQERKLGEWCSSPGISNDAISEFSLLAAYSNKSFPAIAIRKQARANLEGSKSTLKYCHPSHHSKCQALVKCQDSYVPFFESLNDSYTLDELSHQLKLYIKSKDRTTECDTFRDLFLKENPDSKLAQEYGTSGGLLLKELDYFVLGALGKGLSKYELAKQKARENLEHFKLPSDSSGADLVKILLDDSQKCPSFFGRTVVDGIFGKKPPPYPESDSPHNPYNIALLYEDLMRGFNLASLELETLNDKKDALRREACKNFKID